MFVAFFVAGKPKTKHFTRYIQFSRRQEFSATKIFVAFFVAGKQKTGRFTRYIRFCRRREFPATKIFVAFFVAGKLETGKLENCLDLSSFNFFSDENFRRIFRRWKT